MNRRIGTLDEFINENLLEVEMFGAPYDMSATNFPKVEFKKIEKILKLIHEGYKKELSKYKVTYNTIKSILNKEKPQKKDIQITAQVITDLFVRAGIIVTLAMITNELSVAVTGGVAESALLSIFKNGIKQAAGLAFN